MKIDFENDERDHITIEKRADGAYRLWVTTHNGKWREWIANSSDVPHILEFVHGFEFLAMTMINQMDQ